MTDAEHEELAKAVQMCRNNGLEHAAFLLGRAWKEENEKAKHPRKKHLADDNQLGRLEQDGE